ncbi:hypothetical protein [Agrobacterium vitis]|uniref:hypothetical protein n=1 Tax=Agrobacterium vitis TaxID=373 RepID=UPI0008729F6D|nr:hypothetical protein [Agrobacterium vitis]MCM2453388.1 hypothetical protein [Agrobacterium vitis]MCM2470931.1 hypothetical protein [Agrobacterium vitis]MUO70077.1 hypothetical protein [Agrobacterium vitis]
MKLMKLISKQTAMDIALAYREIETAEELLKEVTEALSKREQPDIRDAFGRPQNGLQLGVPSGNDGRRLYNVPWSIVAPIIETHIATYKAKVALLTEKAKAEVSDAAEDSTADHGTSF